MSILKPNRTTRDIYIFLSSLKPQIWREQKAVVQATASVLVLIPISPASHDTNWNIIMLPDLSYISSFILPLSNYALQ